MPPTLTPADEELLELVGSKAWQNGRDLQFATKVTELKAAGADFQRCCLLHVLACTSLGGGGETDLGKVVQLFQLFVSLGADSNYSDPQTGCVPLHLAVSARNEALVKYLLQLGADKQAKNHDGLTPLQAMEAEEQHKMDFLTTFNLGTILPQLSATSAALQGLRRLLA